MAENVYVINLDDSDDLMANVIDSDDLMANVIDSDDLMANGNQRRTHLKPNLSATYNLTSKTYTIKNYVYKSLKFHNLSNFQKPAPKFHGLLGTTSML